MLPSGSLDFISFSINTRSIVGVYCLASCIFAPESVIAIMLALVGLGGVLILFIKLILELLILILLTNTPSLHDALPI